MKIASIILTILICAVKPIYSQRMIHANIGSFGSSSKSNSYYTLSFNSTLGKNLQNENQDKSILLRPFNFNNSTIKTPKISFNLFPNPTTNRVFIQTELQSFSYEIYNTAGAICIAGSSKEIFFRDLTPGVYLIHIIYNQQIIHSQKLILQK
jgi:hypothetical protein